MHPKKSTTAAAVRDVSPPPADVLSRVLEPLWSAAVAGGSR